MLTLVSKWYLPVKSLILILTNSEKEVNIPLREKLRDYKMKGFKIIIFSARNMNTHKEDMKKITKFTLPIIQKWLEDNNVPYDEIRLGKPWCGHEGFYIDDKTIRPDEFIDKSYDEILKIIK